MTAFLVLLVSVVNYFVRRRGSKDYLKIWSIRSSGL